MQLRGRRIPSANHATATKVCKGHRRPNLSPPHNAKKAAPDDISYPNGLQPTSPLSPLSRLYLYSLHGCLCELLFTSVWDFCGTRDVRLQGHSSLWALPMYSTAMLALEGLGQRLLARRLPLPLRLTVYTALIYLWELTWGAGLSLLGACPWDYSGFKYNFKGIITLEYAPFWAIAALIAEKLVIKNTLRIQIL